MTDITELALLVSKAKASVFTLEYISQFEPADIDSDDVDLRFEVDGRDTGTNVSIVDECGQAARVIGALVEALEKAQQVDEELCKLLPPGAEYMDPPDGGDVTPLEGVRRMVADYRQRIAELEPFRTAYMEWSDKTDWVQTDKRFDVLKPWGMHRADVLKAYIVHLESRTATIEPFRSFVTDADLAALHRFAECCDDPESGGHDLEKEQVRRLEEIGALRRSGRVHWITGFGDVLISITAGIKVEAE